MSNRFTKIKYKDEGPYGSTDEKIMFCHENITCDITTFYYEDGTPIFSFPDTIDENIFEKMIEIIKKWKDNPNIENMTYDEIKKLK